MGPDVRPLTDAVLALGNKLDALLAAVNKTNDLLQHEIEVATAPAGFGPTGPTGSHT